MGLIFALTNPVKGHWMQRGCKKFSEFKESTKKKSNGAVGVRRKPKPLVEPTVEKTKLRFNETSLSLAFLPHDLAQVSGGEINSSLVKCAIMLAWERLFIPVCK